MGLPGVVRHSERDDQHVACGVVLAGKARQCSACRSLKDMPVSYRKAGAVAGTGDSPPLGQLNFAALVSAHSGEDHKLALPQPNDEHRMPAIVGSERFLDRSTDLLQFGNGCQIQFNCPTWFGRLCLRRTRGKEGREAKPGAHAESCLEEFSTFRLHGRLHGRYLTVGWTSVQLCCRRRWPKHG